MYRKIHAVHSRKKMYHINDDKRQIASAQKIINGLTQCLSVKMMSEISVSDIATASNVSRSSFYRSFDTPVDVLSYACDQVLDMLLRDYAGIDLEKRDELVLFSLKYWKQHSQILEALANCDRMDIIQRTLVNHGGEFLTNEIGKLHDEFSKEEMEYLSKGVAALLTSTLQVWIQHGRKETPEELFVLYRKIKGIL